MAAKFDEAFSKYRCIDTKVINVVDISKVLDPPPAFFQRLFQQISAFYLEEPWTVLNDRDAIKINVFGKERFLRLEGYEHTMILKIFSDYENCMALAIRHRSTEESYVNGKAFSCSVVKVNTLPSDIGTFMVKHNLPAAYSGWCPVFRNLYGGNFLCKEEFLLLEVIFSLIPKFAQCLVPIDPYQHEHLVMTETVSLSDGRKEMVTVTFPAGNMSPLDEDPMFANAPPMEDHLIVDTKGEHIFELYRSCGRLALPSEEYLTSLETSYLKEILQMCDINIDGCITQNSLLTAAEIQRSDREGSGRLDITGDLSQPCGEGKDLTVYQSMALHSLSSTLLNVKTKQTTLEAIEIMKILLREGNWATMTRYNMIQAYMEIQMYKEALILISEDDGHFEPAWWTAVLLQFIKKGGEAKSTKKAFKRAIKTNIAMIRYLAGIIPVQPINDIHMKEGMDLHRLEKHAQLYLIKYMYAWKKIKGAIKWASREGMKYMWEILDGKQRQTIPHDVLNYTIRNQIPDSEFPERFRYRPPQLKVPNFIFSCQMCKKDKDVNIMRCGQCKSVGYCSRECQMKDWKQHKKVCVKLKEEKEISKQ